MRNSILFTVVSATLLSGIAFVSCKQKNRNNEYYTPREITAATDVPKYNLALNRMDLECFGVHDIIAVDSMIVTITSDKQAMIKVFDYSGNVIARLSPSGRAGNEFLTVSYCDQNSVIDGERHLILKDQDYIYRYNLTGSVRNGANLKPEKLLELPNYEQRANGVSTFFRNDGSYFQYSGVSYNEITIPSSALDMLPDGTFRIKDGFKLPDFEFYPPSYVLIKPNGDTIKYDIYPSLPTFKEDYFADVLYHSVVRMSQDGNKVVIADAFQDRMTYIDLISGDMFGVRCPDFVDYALYSDRADLQSMTVEGAYQMVIYKDYIYVLYDHNTAYEEDKEDKPIDATIRVFNWDGEFIADLIPNAPITNFYIDDKTGKLIAIDNDEQFYMTDLKTQW